MQALIEARQAWRWLTLALALVVCWLALSPTPPPEIDTGWDKANHVLAFAAMAFSGALGFASSRWRVAAALFAFGIAIELAQSQLPPRSADWHDVVADAIGIAVGLLLAAWVRKRYGKPAQQAA